MKMQKENLIGKRFGRLLVLPDKTENIVSKTGRGRPAWTCKCDCGNIVITKAEYLKNGDTKSCGCFSKEVSSGNMKKAHEIITLYTPEIACAREVWLSRYQEESEKDDITFDDFYQLSQMNCHYCDKPASISNKREDRNGNYFFYNGLDRIDSKFGHTVENCVAACKICNQAKTDLSPQLFELWLERIYNFLYKEEINKEI
jgi:hypothetical protein